MYHIEVYDKGEYNEMQDPDDIHAEMTLSGAMDRAKAVMDDWNYTITIRTPGGPGKDAEEGYELPDGSISLFEPGQPGEVVIKEMDTT